MHAEALKRTVNNLRIWQRGDQRAPHKPLLLLYALGRFSRNEPRKMKYEMVKDDLKKLLIEFGPPRATHSPSYPFIRLSNDRAPETNIPIWEISGLEIFKTNKDWKERELVENQTEGGFTEEAYKILKEDQGLVRELTTNILNNNFPSTLHEDILVQVGLELEATGIAARSPDFRGRILKAYEYSCAVCGFNVRLGDTLVAVEAAHIKWHQAGGPDLEQNGIALCTLHHKLFDRGVFTLNLSMVFQVAENAHGTEGMKEWLMRFHGKEIRKPQRPDYYPQDDFINWHVKEVFRGPVRILR